MPPLEKPSAGDLKKKKKCVCGGWRAPGAPGRCGWQRDAGGRCAACPGVASGLMADAGAVARLLRLSATAALCGWRSSTAGFQTITLNICKQIKKQNHPVRVETSVFLSLSVPSALSPLPLGFGGGGWRRAHRPLSARPRPFQPAHGHRHGQAGHVLQTDRHSLGNARTSERCFLFSRVLLRVRPLRATTPRLALGFRIWPPRVLPHVKATLGPAEAGEVHVHVWVTLLSRKIL